MKTIDTKNGIRMSPWFAELVGTCRSFEATAQYERMSFNLVYTRIKESAK